MTDREKGFVTGVGSALVDILIHEPDGFVDRAGAVKGGMKYVDKIDIDHAISMSRNKPVFVPGGSACNTVIGVGQLGGRARFVGKSGNGDMAGFFESTLRMNRVEPILFRSNSLTGRVLSIITPDAERSMLTFLGASQDVDGRDLSFRCFEGSAVVHIEGYLLFNKTYLIDVLRAARAAHARISMDLASFTVVEAAEDFLKSLVSEFVDIVIANEDEARAFTGYSAPDDALKALSEAAPVAALKLGEKGSLISDRETVIRIEPFGNGAVVDTTGAGDLWAAGFLYGLVNDFPLDRCGEIGSLCGYEVCRVVGAKIPEEGWRRIRTAVEKAKSEESEREGKRV